MNDRKRTHANGERELKSALKKRDTSSSHFESNATLFTPPQRSASHFFEIYIDMHFAKFHDVDFESADLDTKVAFLEKMADTFRAIADTHYYYHLDSEDRPTTEKQCLAELIQELYERSHAAKPDPQTLDPARELKENHGDLLTNNHLTANRGLRINAFIRKQKSVLLDDYFFEVITRYLQKLKASFGDRFESLLSDVNAQIHLNLLLHPAPEASRFVVK